MRWWRPRLRSSCRAEKLGCPLASAEMTSPSMTSLPAGSRPTSVAVVGNRFVQSRPGARVEPHAAVEQVSLHPIAVKLEFMNEARTSRDLDPRRGKRRFNEAGERGRLRAQQHTGHADTISQECPSPT